MTGESIRQFFVSLFGSRLVATLELQLLRLRQDYDERLRDKDLIIESLREEKAELSAKVLRYETTIMPLSSRMGAELVNITRPVKPSFTAFDFNNMPPVKSRWEQVQEAYYKAEREAEEAEKSQAAKAPQGTA